MNNYQWGSALYPNEKTLALAIVADWTSAGGHNDREEVEEYLGDWAGSLREMHENWTFTDVQRDALDGWIDSGRIGPDDVLRYLYRVADVHDYQTGDELGFADAETFDRYLEAIAGDAVGAVDGAPWGYPGRTIYMQR
jgi:hypothetical protein